jgi:hypothetical protein
MTPVGDYLFGFFLRSCSYRAATLLCMVGSPCSDTSGDLFLNLGTTFLQAAVRFAECCSLEESLILLQVFLPIVKLSFLSLQCRHRLSRALRNKDKCIKLLQEFLRVSLRQRRERCPEDAVRLFL